MKSEYMEVALQAVKEAESVIYKYLDQDVRAELKADLSPVTVADKEAEEAIKRIILKHFSDHTFYGEEGEKTNLSNHSGYTWVIDPIDGTKSYLRKNPLFATQLALMHNGEFILGVSNAPLMNELMYAEKGQGCFLNGERVRVSSVENMSDSYISFGSLKYFRHNSTDAALMALAEEAKWARGIGDFWSYHLLAQGKLEVMIEAETKLWDIAAMTVIVTEAGGSMTQLNGQPIDFKTTTAIATNGLVHDAVVETFSA